ncbi:MAG: hypothetical protein ABFD57_09955 [Smithella sp.]|nr:hypothetical protein [Syntrophaceae bacterium]
MDPKQIAKQMISFNKAAFDHNFHAMSSFYEQIEKFINKFWEKSPVFPEEGKKAISEWMNVYKKSCQDFQNAVDENFKKMEEIFTEQK